MCGIALTFSSGRLSDVQQDFIRSSVDLLAHRGPDANGIYVDHQIGLAHTRLKIIDLSELANQPYENERYALIFNGEIFNFQELRLELAPKHCFVSNSDTEVLFYALIEWGENALEHLIGQFAFAFYDKKDSTLIIARDIAGICPLYYYQENGTYYCSSEIKPLLKVTQPRLDLQSAWTYFQFRFAVGENTLFKGIRRFPAAHYLKIDLKNGRQERARYFNQSRSGNTVSRNLSNQPDLQEEFNNRFDRIIRRQLIADVPVGMYLSGGIDSTAVLKYFSRQATDFKTFTLQFDREDLEDVSRVNNLEKQISFQKNLVLFTKNTESDLLDAVSSLEDLFGDLIILANYQLAKEAAKNVKVVLSGEGGDEVFFGYEHQAKLKRICDLNRILPLSHFGSLAVKLAPISLLGKLLNYPGRFGKMEQRKLGKILGSVGDPLSLYYNSSVLFDREETTDCFEPSFLKQIDLFHLPQELTNIFSEEESVLDAVYRADLEQVLLPINLTKQDRFSMRFSMEGRVPLLDKENLQFAQGLPHEDLYAKQSKKHLISYGGYSQNSFIKKPFSILGNKDYLRFIDELCKKHLSAERVSQMGLFKLDYIDRLRPAAFRQEILPMKKLMSLLTFSIWVDTFNVHLSV